MIGFIRFLLVALLVIGVIVIARGSMGGLGRAKGGGGGEGGG